MFYSALVVALSVVAVFGQSCDPEYNEYFADSQQCDRYVECLDGVASEKLCPAGLLFNELAAYGAFPCSYPTEVDCGARSIIQPAQPSENCGNSWGYFGSGDRSVCDIFYNCVDGVSFRFNCPEGLAFSSSSYRCEYPEDSADCDASAYLGFTCPQTRDESQVLLVGTPRYASPRDCRKFFLCVGASPRLQTCELGTVFNDAIHGCDEPENVGGCSDYYPAAELADIRARKEARRVRAEERQAAYRQRLNALNN